MEIIAGIEASIANIPKKNHAMELRRLVLRLHHEATGHAVVALQSGNNAECFALLLKAEYYTREDVCKSLGCFEGTDNTRQQLREKTFRLIKAFERERCGEHLTKNQIVGPRPPPTPRPTGAITPTSTNLLVPPRRRPSQENNNNNNNLSTNIVSDSASVDSETPSLPREVVDPPLPLQPPQGRFLRKVEGHSKTVYSPTGPTTWRDRKRLIDANMGELQRNLTMNKAKEEAENVRREIQKHVRRARWLVRNGNKRGGQDSAVPHPSLEEDVEDEDEDRTGQHECDGDDTSVHEDSPSSQQQPALDFLHNSPVKSLFEVQTVQVGKDSSRQMSLRTSAGKISHSKINQSTASIQHASVGSLHSVGSGRRLRKLSSEKGDSKSILTAQNSNRKSIDTFVALPIYENGSNGEVLSELIEEEEPEPNQSSNLITLQEEPPVPQEISPRSKLIIRRNQAAKVIQRSTLRMLFRIHTQQREETEYERRCKWELQQESALCITRAMKCYLAKLIRDEKRDDVLRYLAHMISEERRASVLLGAENSPSRFISSRSLSITSMGTDVTPTAATPMASLYNTNTEGHHQSARKIQKNWRRFRDRKEMGALVTAAREEAHFVCHEVISFDVAEQGESLKFEQLRVFVFDNHPSSRIASPKTALKSHASIISTPPFVKSSFMPSLPSLYNLTSEGDIFSAVVPPPESLSCKVLQRVGRGYLMRLESYKQHRYLAVLWRCNSQVLCAPPTIRVKVYDWSDPLGPNLRSVVESILAQQKKNVNPALTLVQALLRAKSSGKISGLKKKMRSRRCAGRLWRAWKSYVMRQSSAYTYALEEDN